MCGIAGEIVFKGTSNPERTEAACAAMVHRGPDQLGLFASDRAVLGMRRLKVVGLVGGEQPVYSADRRYVTVFNGEIYNHHELRAQLERQGVPVEGSSDAQVIPHLFAQYGEQFVHRLRGMFAISMYDTVRHALYLFTDRAGKKPIFTAQTSTGFVFASELAPLLSYPGVDTSIDPAAIDQYLSYRIIAAPKTIYNGVQRLLPATSMHVQDGGISTYQYWKMSIDDVSTAPAAEATVVDDLAKLLESAVEDRIEAEVPLGAMLSGGLDSSLVVALLHKYRPYDLNTFSIDFAEPEFDESVHARLVSEHFATHHHRYRIDVRDAVEAIDPILLHIGEPYGFPSAIASYYMYRLAKQHVTVVLTGDGSDEIFAGYNRYKVFSALPNIAPEHQSRVDPFELAVAADVAGQYQSVLIDGLRNGLKSQLYSETFKQSLPYSFPTNHLSERFDQLSGDTSSFARILEVDYGFWLSDAQLVKIDRMSMAHAVEARSPMLDHRVVEYVGTLPLSMKLDGTNEKAVLKKVASRYLPPSIIQRRKQELAVPLESWTTGRLREVVQSTLLSDVSLERGYFDADALMRFVKDFRPESSYALWTLFMLERWHQLFIDRATDSLLDRLPA